MRTIKPYAGGKNMIALKKGIALALGLVLLAGCGSSQKQETETPKEEKLEKIELSVAKTEINVDEELEITVVTAPKDIEIKTSSFQEMKDATIEKKDDKYMFKATKAGTYTILAKQDSIDSNTLKVKVNGEETDEEENQTNNETASSQTTSNQQALAEAGSASNEQVIVGADGTPHNDPNWNASDAVEVSAVMNNPDHYVGEKITIIGHLPQQAAIDSQGNYYPAIYPNTDTTDGLRLDGASVDIGGCVAELTGTLQKQNVGDDSYVFNVESYRMITDGSAGQ